MGFEGPNFGNTEEAPEEKTPEEELDVPEEEVSQWRNQHNWQQRAQLRNEYRPLKDKLLFRNKVGAEDVMVEEAHSMNEQVDQAMESGNAETAGEAVEQVAGQEEFQDKKLEWEIENEEFARAKLEQVNNALESNDFRTVLSVYSEIEGEVRKAFDKQEEHRIEFQETSRQMKGDVRESIAQKFNELSESADAESFKEAFAVFNGTEILQNNNIQSPAEALSVLENAGNMPEARTEMAREWIKKGVLGYIANDDSATLSTIINRLDKAGVLSSEDEEVKKETHDWAVKHLDAEVHQLQPHRTILVRNELVEAGFMTVEEGNELIRERASDDLEFFAGDIMITSIKTYENVRDLYAKEGIISAEEAEQLEGVTEARAWRGAA